MKVLKNFLQVKDNNQLILGVVLIVYILLHVRTPHAIAPAIDTVLGNVVVTGMAILIFRQSKPVIGVLGLIAAYLLIKRSSMETGTHAIRTALTSERAKVRDFARYNQFPVTLEEEMVKKMAPLVKHAPAKNAEYTPVLDPTHHAAPIDYTGVI
tara:strand:- start:809 stop:1270 length:462 start_codon:yes stop_codon:yes gene_type:complete